MNAHLRHRSWKRLCAAIGAALLAAHGAGCVGGVVPARSPAHPTTDRPNIVLVVVDDLGQQDVSVPMLGEASALNRRFRTPNLEKLAARGIRFSNAYAAAPVCTPSRTAIMTGLSPARTRITYWTLERNRDTSSRHPALDPPAWQMNGLAPSGRELPHALGDAGYAAIHVGKAHFGARDTPGADPRSLGFEVSIAGHAAGAPGSFLGTDHFKENARRRRGQVAPEEAPASVWDVPGLARWHGQAVWLDHALATEACGAIEAAHGGGRPFFLHFCPYGVHVPIMEDARFASDHAGLDATERAYATMVAAVDDALGEIIKCCERLGVLDNTVIVFTSDNGGLSAHGRGAAPDGTAAHRHNAPLRSGKGSAYEGGLRVPLVIAGPGIPHRDEPLAAPVVGTDLHPTLLALAGATPAPGVADGIDLSAYWRNGTQPPTRPILFHQPHKWGPEGPGIEPFSALRIGDWKVVWFHDPSGRGPRVELYDAARDPGETEDRSVRDPARRSEMLRALRAALADTDAQLPTLRSTGEPVCVPE